MHPINSDGQHTHPMRFHWTMSTDVDVLNGELMLPFEKYVVALFVSFNQTMTT